MKKVTAIVIAFIMVLSISVPAFAEGGTWYLDDQGWWYLNEDGTFPADEWLLYNDSWYLFDADGYMMTGWALYDDEWYYMNGAGIMETGWIWDGNAWYLMGDNGAWTGRQAAEEPADNEGQGGAGKADNNGGNGADKADNKAGGAAASTTNIMVDKFTGDENEAESGNKPEEQPAEEPNKPAEGQPEEEPTQPADNNGKKINATVVLSDGTNCPVISCTEENDGSTAKLSVTFSVDASKGIYDSFIATFGESVVFGEDHINNEILKNASKLPFESSNSKPLTTITLNLQLSKDIHTNLFDASAVYSIARNYDKDGNPISYTKIMFDRGISGSGNNGNSTQPANNSTPNPGSNGSQGNGESANPGSNGNQGRGETPVPESNTNATVTAVCSDGTVFKITSYSEGEANATSPTGEKEIKKFGEIHYSVEGTSNIGWSSVVGISTEPFTDSVINYYMSLDVHSEPGFITNVAINFKDRNIDNNTTTDITGQYIFEITEDLADSDFYLLMINIKQARVIEEVPVSYTIFTVKR